MLIQQEDSKIKAAVEWWADKLRACKQSGLSNEERADPSNIGYTFGEALMVANKPKVSDEQILKFSESLATSLKNLKLDYLCLMTDYGPGYYLREALEAAEIPLGYALPIKTRMFIDDEKVTVCYGYGAGEEQICPAKP